MMTTSRMLSNELEGTLTWLTDLQILAVKTGKGWRQIMVRKTRIII